MLAILAQGSYSFQSLWPITTRPGYQSSGVEESLLFSMKTWRMPRLEQKSIWGMAGELTEAQQVLDK